MHKNMSLKEVFIRFKPFYKKYWKQFVFVVLGMILTSVGTAGSFAALKPILDYVFVEKNETLLYILPFLLVGIYVIKNAGFYLQSYYLSYIGIDTLRILRSKILQNLLRLDMDFFKRNRNGELISRCTNDIGALQSIVATIIPEFFRELLTIIGLIAVVFYQSVTLALFAFIVLPCAIFPLIWFAKKIRKYARSIQETNADLLSKLNEIFSNIELIKASNTEKKEDANFSISNDHLCKVNLKSSRLDSLVSPMMETIGVFGVAAVIIVGGHQVIHGTMSVGSFFAFISALFYVYTPLKKLTSLYARLQTAVVASERTFYLLDLEPEILGGERKIDKIQSIEFKHVKFSYKNPHKSVLNDVSFAFKRGEILALVGPSGGGKSSIVNLLLYFYEKNSGQILFNNFDISELNIQNLRDKIGLVTQNIYLFNDTFAQNVAYSEVLDEMKVIKALKLANAYEFVEQMGGIYAEIKEHGKNLSGGQKQRIAIARALYKDPCLLIFDEATSALDNESEKAIIKTINNLKKDRLILIIAHRLSTVENADKIAVIDQGKVQAIGTDKELLQTCELYQKFKEKN